MNGEEAFARLASEEQATRLGALARVGLVAFGLPPDAALTLLKHRENVVFRVDRPDTGARAVLRVHRPGYQTAASIRSELAWIEALRAAGVPTPPVLRAPDGDVVRTIAHPDVPGVRQCDLLGWVHGTPLDADGSLDAYRLLGVTCARLHRHARAWKLPPGFTRQCWDEAGMFGPAPLWGRYADLAALGPAERALFDRGRKRALDRLAGYGKAPDRFGLIHADLMPDNVLMADGTAHVIDFDDCGFGWFLYDLATLLAADVAAPDLEPHRDAWLEGYRTVAPLAEEDLTALDALLTCRLLVGLGWLHTRRETPFARELTDVAVALARVQAERFLGASG